MILRLYILNVERQRIKTLSQNLEKSLFIIGAGRQAMETFYLCKDHTDYEPVGFIDENAIDSQFYMNLPVYNMDDFKKNVNLPEILLINAIGNISISKRLSSSFEKIGVKFINLFNKEIPTDGRNDYGYGITIGQGTILTSNIRVGNHVLINVGCTISHDCIIEDFCNISPGCHLAGHVILESEVFLGTGVSIIPKVKIGRGSIIGAGSVIIRDVPENSLVAGVPGRIIKKL